MAKKAEKQKWTIENSVERRKSTFQPLNHFQFVIKYIGYNSNWNSDTQAWMIQWKYIMKFNCFNNGTATDEFSSRFTKHQSIFHVTHFIRSNCQYQCQLLSSLRLNYIIKFQASSTMCSYERKGGHADINTTAIYSFSFPFCMQIEYQIFTVQREYWIS